MIETFHVFVETAQNAGVDHIASFFIVVQLGVVGVGVAGHTAVHAVVFTYRRIRRPPPTVAPTHRTARLENGRRYVPIYPPRP